MKKFLLIASLVTSSLFVSAQKNTPQSYIEQFKDDAIRIMHETGVPASIVLGVAMHESGCGNSLLAQHLNNQFGVKGSGHITYVNKHNKKVSTAYKRYESVYESYQDFARMMTELPQFTMLPLTFGHSDYKGWAHGISSHGYASSHTWESRVLGIIKKYKLYVLDEKPEEEEAKLAQNNKSL
jgi:flagellum-specific peptidoglycan hydrolase FlgJ